MAQNPTFTFSFDSLYCPEQHYEQQQEEQQPQILINPFPTLVEQDLFCEETELHALFSKEESNDLYLNLKKNPSLVDSRCEAITWMLKVHTFYNFSPLTVVLAVNYLDRFFFNFFTLSETRKMMMTQQQQQPWMTQLIAVACLSLASKVEETHVPFLVDFQVEDCEFEFEAKTIQKMELLVLSTLQWKMNPATPNSFIDYIARRLKLKDHLCLEFLSRCENVLLSVISDWRFLCYLPSVVGTAIMLYVIGSLEPCPGVDCQNQLLDILEIDKKEVESCCELILDLESRRSIYLFHKRKFGSAPGSPRGVVDACLSSDASNDSWVVTESIVSLSSSPPPEPLSKRRRSEG